MYDTLGREALQKQLYHMIEVLSIAAPAKASL